MDRLTVLRSVCPTWGRARATLEEYVRDPVGSGREAIQSRAGVVWVCGRCKRLVSCREDATHCDSCGLPVIERVEGSAHFLAPFTPSTPNAYTMQDFVLDLEVWVKLTHSSEAWYALCYMAHDWTEEDTVKAVHKDGVWLTEMLRELAQEYEPKPVMDSCEVLVIRYRSVVKR